MNHHSSHHHAESSKKEYLKFAAVILSIIGISVGLFQLLELEGAMNLMRIFMGVFFLVFAGFKFAGYKMFATMFAGYDIIGMRSRMYAWAYPFIELALGIAYLANFMPVFRDSLTLLIMSIGAIGVWQEIKKRSGVHCACLGNIIKLPLSIVSLVEDVTMGLMALAMLLWLT